MLQQASPQQGLTQYLTGVQPASKKAKPLNAVAQPASFGMASARLGNAEAQHLLCQPLIDTNRHTLCAKSLRVPILAW